MVYKEWCIPRVHRSITEEIITSKMTQMKVGKVISVKNIILKNQNNYCRSIIKMDCDALSENYKYIENYLKDEKYFKLVYQFPEYWRIFPNLPQKQR